MIRPSPVPEKPGKVLVTQLDHIGDAVFAIPALRALRGVFLDAEITVLCASWSADLVEACGYVDRVMVFDAPWFADRRLRRSAKRLVRQGLRLRKEHFDLSIDFRGDMRHIALAYLAGIPARAGYGITGGEFLLSLAPGYPGEENAVQRNLTLVKALAEAVSAATGTGDERLELRVKPEAAASVEGLVQELGLGDRPIVVIHPGAGSPTKKWSVDRYAAVADALKEAGNVDLVITGSAGETDLARRMRSFMNSEATVLAGRLSVGELAALLKQAALFIGGDTGPLHMAVALGVPSVALMSGTNDPAVWGPFPVPGKEVRVVKSDVDCAPCGLDDCPTLRCMDGIEVTRVVDSAVDLLKRRYVPLL